MWNTVGRKWKLTISWRWKTQSTKTISLGLRVVNCLEGRRVHVHRLRVTNNKKKVDNWAVWLSSNRRSKWRFKGDVIGVEVKLQVVKKLMGNKVLVIKGAFILSVQAQLNLAKLIHIKLKVLSDKISKKLLSLSTFISLKHSSSYDQCKTLNIHVHVKPWVPSEGRH